VNRENDYRNLLYFAAILLLLPALWINLGLHTLIDDEAIRSLVAMEMKLSGNYITPTINGEYYFNKPPLFNWILLVFFTLAGSFGEFAARFPTTLALIGYGLTIYHFFRKHYDRKTAFLNAFVFITCGRVLFWDSMLALIDITFSWATFTAFMVVYHEFKKGNYYRLFLLSYFLTAIGFLLKGLPSVVFQGTTLLVFFIYQKQFRKLFSAAHVLGSLLFLAIVGSYYYVFSQQNSLEIAFSTLFSESSKRTVVNYGVGNTIVHFFTFPFEMVYHFLPWSLMIIYFIRKDVIRLIRADEFIAYNLIIFLANILVYWTSPEVYPRYLLMLAPLIFSAFIYLHGIHREGGTWQFRFLDRLFLFMVVAVALGSFAPLFLERTQGTPYLYLKTFAWGFGLLGAAALYYRLPGERLVALALFLLVFRIGFNWFVLPDRNANDFGDLCRATSIEAGRKFAAQDMYIYKQTHLQFTNSYYLTRERMQIVRRLEENFDPDAVYIIDPEKYPDVNYEKVGEIKIRHGQLTYDIGILEDWRIGGLRQRRAFPKESYGSAKD
jgi:4-amino-4-deoxy-L-arabinose transferase-like glycosyltransferase